MSLVKISGNASGTGTFTIASPNSNTDRTITLPDNTGTILTTGSQIEFGAGTVSAPSITTTGDTNTGIFFPAADTIAFAEGGAEAMRIDSSGNLNIGTTGYGTYFSSNKNISLGEGATIRASASGGDPYITISSNAYFTNTPDWKYVVTDFASSYEQYNGTHVWSNAASGTAGNTITFTERMRIDSSGNVGIGTSSPSQKLHVGVSSGSVVGLAESTATNGEASWQISGKNSSGTARSAIFKYDNSDLIRIGTASAIAMRFETSDTERARITSGGRLEIASTGSVVTTSETLSVHGITGMGGTGSTTLYRLYVSNAAGSNATSPMIRFSTTDGIAGTIISTTTSTTYATSSDYRLKENIAPMTGALDKVAQLNPVTYNWKSNGLASQGFIAHELQAVCPDAVTGKKDETEIQQIEVSPAVPATYDEDGNELTPAVEATYEEREVPVYQGVDTSFLVATLTAAIQELKAITDAQATRIEALEAEVAAMKANNGN